MNLSGDIEEGRRVYSMGEESSKVGNCRRNNEGDDSLWFFYSLTGIFTLLFDFSAEKSGQDESVHWQTSDLEFVKRCLQQDP